MRMNGVDVSSPALILKAGRGVLHHGALGIARSLGRLGAPVYAIVDDMLAPLALSRYLARSFVWKRWPDKTAFPCAIAAIAERIGSPALLLPLDDLSAAVVAENAEALRRWFLLPAIAPGLPRRLCDKATLYEICAQAGIDTPRIAFAHDEADVDAFVERSGFPVMIKTAEQWAPLNGGRSTIIAREPADLRRFWAGARGATPARMLVQEFVPGEDWVYHGYRNAETGVQVGFTGRKLMSSPPGAGSTVLGVSERDDSLARLGESLLRQVQYSGIVGIDWRKDARDGRFRIVDCNPRVCMNFRMFHNDAGVDVVRAAYLDLTGQPIPGSRMAEGHVFKVEQDYLFLGLKEFLKSGSTAKAEARPVARSGELAWFAYDDPAPAAMMGLRFPLQIASRWTRRMSGFPLHLSSLTR
ncbi:putative ATP-grasp superfamily ATP-dependent carboligase [Roseiarcus fermentans]|uniref:Putative ATP-grasp superfamily ATP-dependent carboligase n=1 Tax=Roseiarcus fermentans TaxID=1473586 RepID=A0A366FRV0_9HYPH|nr:ATP-grasp domain-containing protein [Roseiarcus fermentans]RBP16886.1 putative ATP-grasp superfamily ATP-dependent carboligase [Roseiarcus fermentans]